jgi:hypothetical protein
MPAADGSGDIATKFLARLAGLVRAERQGNRPLMARRARQRPCRRPAPSLTETEVLAALVRAWLAAMIAVVLLCGALALASIWDGAIFCDALHEALTTNPELPQPADEFPINRHDAALRPWAR